MARGKESLRAFTERAIEGMHNGTLIPPMVYLPATMKRQRARLKEIATIAPADAAECAARVAQADPTGFLIAMMNGQPVPVFKLHRGLKDGGTQITVEYEVPDLRLRSDIAIALAEVGRLNTRNTHKAGDAGYEAMIARAAGMENGSQQDS